MVRASWCSAPDAGVCRRGRSGWPERFATRWLSECGLGRNIISHAVQRCEESVPWIEHSLAREALPREKVLIFPVLLNDGRQQLQNGLQVPLNHDIDLLPHPSVSPLVAITTTFSPENPSLRKRPVMSSTFDDKIEDYEVLDLLGKGGFARVYRAHSKKGQEVAIKTACYRACSKKNVQKVAIREADRW